MARLSGSGQLSGQLLVRRHHAHTSMIGAYGMAMAEPEQVELRLTSAMAVQWLALPAKFRK